MITNVEVERSPNESNTSLVRRFTKSVKNAGIIRKVRGRRYKERNKSKYIRRKQTIKILKRREEIQRLIKLGKISEKTR